MLSLDIPSVDDLAIEPLLGTLVVLEAALVAIARGLRGAYPEIDRVPWPREPQDTAAARHLVDQCDDVLHALDHYRDHLRATLREAFAPDSCPF